LARVPETLFSPEDLETFTQVFEELKLRYTSNLDRPESHLSLGILAENQQPASCCLKITIARQCGERVHMFLHA
jgi:hypothetical protein